MRKEELIEKYEYLNHDCFRRVDVSEVLGDLKKLDEPQSIKLKEVIARIKIFDVGTQKVWLNEILNELGSDYGTLKYKDGYEQGKLEGSMIPYEEPQKVTVPQFVADWIEYAKFEDYHLLGAMDSIAISGRKNLDEWFRGDDDNMELFARAWIDGYTVEKEPKYTVKIKAVNQYLVRNKDEDFLGFLQSRLKSKFTRKELEDAGLEEVFNSPLFEVEEVE